MVNTQEDNETFLQNNPLSCSLTNIGLLVYLYFAIILKNPMISKVNKSAKTIRTMNRKEIFALNRRIWKRVVEKSDEAEFNILQNQVKVKSDQGIEQEYKTIIDTFSRINYGVRDIKDLISMLNSQDIINTHRGLIGLNSLGYNIVTQGNEQELLMSNIIFILVRIICELDYPFLQIRSLNILNKITDRTPSHIFSLYFNPLTFPQEIFLHLVESSNETVHSQTISLLKKVKEKRYSISAADDNIHFLTQIQEKIQAQNRGKGKLNRIVVLLNLLDVQFWFNRKIFANKYYKIKHRILQLYIDNNQFDNIDLMIRHLANKDQLGKIFTNLASQSQRQLKQVDAFIRKLIILPFELKFDPRISNLNILLYSIMDCEKSTAYLPHEHILAFISSVITQEENSGVMLICLITLKKMLYLSPQTALKSILRQESLLNRFSQLYQFQQKKIIQELNTIVYLLIQNNKSYQGLELLQPLIELYFQKCNTFDRMTAKSALQSMHWRLNSLKSSDYLLFQLLKRIIMTDKNRDIIQKIKATNDIARASNYCDYFLEMWKPKEIEIDSDEEKPNEIQLSPNEKEKYVKNAVICISDDDQ